MMADADGDGDAETRQIVFCASPTPLSTLSENSSPAADSFTSSPLVPVQTTA